MWAVTQDVSSAALANIKDSAHLNQNVQIRSPGYCTSVCNYQFNLLSL